MIKTLLAALLIASPVFAVQTAHWVHTSEADFKKGAMHNVVATNLGDVKLSRAVKTILDEDAKVGAVYGMVEAPDGAVYAATGPHGVLLRVKDDKATPLATFDDNTNLFSLLLEADGSLVVGVSGEKGRVFRIAHPEAEDAKPTEVFADDSVQYIWGLQNTPDGNLYIATGPNGKLFELKPDGSKSVLLASDESNLLSLLSDGKDTLYVGTDPNGLVYRVNRKSKEVFVVFDAPESEISCLALDGKGNLYVGTAEAQDDADPAKPTAADAADAEKAGRPEGTGGVPLPSSPPALPKPPGKPDPNPGEPEPIPKMTYRRAHQFYDVVDNPALPNPNPGDKKRPAPASQPANAPAAPLTPANEVPAAPKAPGNAIYKIDPEGFVTEVFRQPVMILSMLEHEGSLLVGTGSEGLIYQVSPASEETVVLAKVDPKQVLSLLATKDGRVLLGFANVGGIAAMSSGFAGDGTFTSPVLDATQISRFGKIHLQGSMPKGTGLTIATRSGNVQDPGKAGWSNWSDEAPATEYFKIPSPSARFLQYRLTFESKEGKATPLVDEVDVAYQTPNVAPVVKSVHVGAPTAKVANDATTSATPDANRVLPILWEAEDANNDALQFSLYFRNSPKSPWILLKDKLTDPHFEWDTRTVADGRYEIKVIASDALANPPGEGKVGGRVSDPVVIDNTAPVLGDVEAVVKGDSAMVSARAVDRTSIVAAIEYSLDSSTDWQLVLPSDKLFDSPEEAVSFTVSKLTAGAHQLTLRATDAKGNQAFETVQLTVELKPAKH